MDRRRFLGLSAAALATPVAGCAWLDERERRAIYRPTPGVPEGFAGLRTGERTWFVPASDTIGDGAATDAPPAADERVQLWRLPATTEAAPTLLYLHGTFRNAYQNLPKMRALQSAGFDVIAVEYRGWGESSPRVPSEHSIVADAATGWRALAALQPDARRRVIFGHSMGGAAAVALASGLAAGECAQVVLESTFTSFAQLARSYGWFAGLLGRWTGQRFDSLARIGRVKAPILFLHGTADRTVPWSQGQALFDAAPQPKRFVSFEGGSHSGLHEDDPALYQSTLGALARSLR